MEHFTIPYSGELLVSHMIAYGLGTVLDASEVDVFIGHDADSQSYEPVVSFAAGLDEARVAIRRSAERAKEIVEHDIEPGKRGNDRRATIWARASLDGNRARLEEITALRADLLEQAERAGSRIPILLLAGLGAPAAWGSAKLKSSYGATALDGVLGNHTSDFVRGVLRPMRSAAVNLAEDPFAPTGEQLPKDKTNWAPEGTRVAEIHQWLAALGLALLPVAHRPMNASETPACWRGSRGRRGITLPILPDPVSIARLRALLAASELAKIIPPAGVQDTKDGMDDERERELLAAGKLRGCGVNEVVSFERRNRSGAGSSVAFDFRRGRRIDLRMLSVV